MDTQAGSDRSWRAGQVLGPVAVVAGLLAVPSTAAAAEGGSFFDQFVVAGGGIVYYVLIPMSLIAVYRIFELMVLVRRRRLVPDAVGRQIATTIQQFGLGSLVSRLAGRVDLVSRAMYRAVTQSQGSVDRHVLEDMAEEALHDEALRLLRKAELCNTIGNVAPMVGLFGTVYGMIQAFGILAISEGQPRSDELAAKISVALVTTFWGLLIAIPSLTVYGVVRTRLEGLVSEATLQIEMLLQHVSRPGGATPAEANASSGERGEPGPRRREPRTRSGAGR
ncbi:MAG TPA: MotA/TolQ/ExbB proton channel family protein [Phycisphaerales bacterium]|nr:MotA/TolQ/ExbB proton channel family protein [Phycisphaerales bacterium]